MQNIERDKNLCIQGQKGKERQTDFQSVRGQPQFPLSGVVGSAPNLPKIIGQGERGAEGRVLEVWFCVPFACSCCARRRAFSRATRSETSHEML